MLPQRDMAADAYLGSRITLHDARYTLRGPL